MEESSVRVTTSADLIAAESSPRMLRSTMSTPDSPSESSDDCETPECKCAICLGRLRNKSLIDSCFHEFCFECLVEWSKVKAECPLCKTKFDYIIHNVKSNDDYEKYHLQSAIQPERVPTRNWQYDLDREIPAYLRGIRFVDAEGAIQHFATLPERHGGGRSRFSRNQDATAFRRSVYSCSLWVQPLSDFTNRFRESSPAFYRDNPAQVYRLVRWLQRELRVLLPRQSSQRTIVMHAIVNSIFRYPMRSSTLARELQPYLGANTRHFIHEFSEFARSPFDMGGHDRSATYMAQRPPPVEVVLNSPTNSDVSGDNFDDLLNSSGSDIEIIESNVPSPVPVAGPSGIMRSRAPRRQPSLPYYPNLTLTAAETHEIFSSSSSDECEVIGSFKPPSPEVIDILSDDDEIQPEQSATVAETVDLRTPRTHSERPVSLNQETETPHLERTPGVTSPGLLEVSTDRPPLVLKIESGRIKPHRAKRRRHSSSSWGSSSDSSDRDIQRSRSTKKRWRWSDSDSDHNPEEEQRGRIPSVVVPQPSFKAEGNSSPSSRREAKENDDSGSDNNNKREVREHKERSRKKKKSKHTRKHKRSHRAVEDEDRGEGTSGSGSSRRCKTCRHRHCHCNRGASGQSSYKRIKINHRETTEERESASGSSRSRSKARRHSKLKYSDSKCSDSSG